MVNFNDSEDSVRLIVRNLPVPGYPQASDIHWRLQMLNDPADTLVMLRGPGNYMQCAGSADGGFRIECREGQHRQPFRAADAPIDLETTNQLFVSYLNGDNRWREMTRWADGSMASGSGDASSKRFGGLLVRAGNTWVISKRWCLVVLGGLCCVGAAISFLTLNDLMDLYLTWIPGSILAVGVICLTLSCFVED